VNGLKVVEFWLVFTACKLVVRFVARRDSGGLMV